MCVEGLPGGKVSVLGVQVRSVLMDTGPWTEDTVTVFLYHMRGVEVKTLLELRAVLGY